VFAFATDDLPPNTAAVATKVGIRIYQKAGDGVLAERFEEILAGGPRSERPADGHRVLVERVKDFVLLLRSCGRESFDAGKHFAGPGLKFSHSLGVKLLVTTREGGKRAVDEINNSGLAGTRCLVGGNDTGGDRVDFRSQIWSKEFETWRSRRLRRTMGVLRGGQGSRPMYRNPSGRDTADTAEEKSSARKRILQARGLVGISIKRISG
jgi:hypothetical protein